MSFKKLSCIVVLAIVSCGKESITYESHLTTFSKIPSNTSRITFSNNIVENDSLNYFKFPYIYMGGGVAIADINNDGLQDVFLTGNMVENKLYLNKGNMQFQDIAKSSNINAHNRWYTGITVVDINTDGYLDFYLSVSGKYGNTQNQLLINNGDLTFSEKAAAYGIDDASTSIQSTFFDYDNDGDLDLFVANYPMVPLTQGNTFYSEKMKGNNPEESGHLYRNNGDDTFTNVTELAGVQNFGLTLGLVAADFNNDGWKDLYLSNDFNVPDYFYINNGDGTFKEVIKETTGHTSTFGMGIDAADFNNDSFMDLIQTDMTPEDYVRAKVNMASMNPQNFNMGVQLGFHYQYMQNSLQVNNGVNGEGLPIMSEISRLAGISSTDWSWSTLFADLDNDGWKDIYITNGMKRDVNDNDVNKSTDKLAFKPNFNLQITDYPSEPIANYTFKNKGDHTFEKKGKAWGLDFKGFSNGAAYGDLDNDGDLDLVVNNIDQEASIYRNNTQKQNYLRLSFLGPAKNPLGLGVKVTLIGVGDITQMQEFTLTRGFQSSMEPIMHFGLGTDTKPKQMEVLWPDGKIQVINGPKINDVLNIKYAEATQPEKTIKEETKTFQDITRMSNIDFEHQEDAYDDYSYEPLLPYKYSMLGPALASGDINNDGLDDFYIGNAAGSSGALFVQKTDGTFDKVNGPWNEDFHQEDVGAVFADLDNDGDQDLYVASGGGKTNDHTDRIYINTGNGFMKLMPDSIKKVTAGKAIAVCDYDKDGLMDIFIGGRNVPGNYPFAPMSYLLKNIGGIDENLKFKDVTEDIAQDLGAVGMITKAVWADIDGDTWEDLILVGEWMPITIFKNDKGELVNKTKEWGLQNTQGWWYAIESLDVDNDGDLDLVVGNLGENHKYQTSINNPFEVYGNDFDKNGTSDIVFSYQKGHKKVPLRGRECSSQQVPGIAHRYKTFREFAKADLSEIYGTEILERSLHYQAHTFSHHWFENKEGKTFKSHVLPKRTQFSPINAIECIDYNGDDYQDLILTGNLYQSEVETPRSDGGVGLILIGSPKGFIEVPPSESKLMVREDVKSMCKIQLQKSKTAYLLGVNNGQPKLLMLPTK